MYLSLFDVLCFHPVELLPLPPSHHGRGLELSDPTGVDAFERLREAHRLDVAFDLFINIVNRPITHHYNRVVYWWIVYVCCVSRRLVNGWLGIAVTFVYKSPT